jgi:phage FluMu gp28-like protein
MRRSSVAQMLLRLAGHGLTLYGWQRRFIDDSSRFRILLKPRGAGATFTVALEALTNALLKPKTTTILLSYSLRQSLEIFRHVKELLEKISSNTVKLNGLPYRLQHTTGQRSTMLGNGSRIISLPNNPETLRLQGRQPIRRRGRTLPGRLQDTDSGDVHNRSTTRTCRPSLNPKG